MSKTITLTANDGTKVEFVDEIIGSDAMKDVYLSPDKSYVVGFFREPVSPDYQKRMIDIIGIYRKIGLSCYGNLFCWPTKMVEWDGKIGVVYPSYQKHFFFSSGNVKGKVKEGQWFASAKLRNRFLPTDEKGTWLSYYHICIKIAKAVKLLHSEELIFSDLSYKNILVDPITENVCFIMSEQSVIDTERKYDFEKYFQNVVGTPDFIAPEIFENRNFDLGDSNKILPSIQTDRHALAVLIYMYLLYRHPLRGGKVNDLDAAKDEELSMGKMALFIEHPTDKSNRPKVQNLAPSELPQGDVTKLPYTICGPYLKALFDRAFIDGLHNPSMRPTADEWEQALIKTTDLMQPCQNPNCESKWFVFDNTTKPRCPFCGKEYHGQLPVLNLYYSPKKGVFKPENYRLMVYDKQSLYKWHVNQYVSPNERISAEDKKPVGDFHFHNGKWILINRRLNSLYDKDEDRKIEIGQYVELTEGKKILLSTEDGGRLIIVQLVNN